MLPAYEQMVKASHAFNLLDARHAVSVTERQRFILRVRTLARGVAEAYRDSREALGFPLLKNARPATRPDERERPAVRVAHGGIAAAHAASLSTALTEGLVKGIDAAGVPHGTGSRLRHAAASCGLVSGCAEQRRTATSSGAGRR